MRRRNQSTDAGRGGWHAKYYSTRQPASGGRGGEVCALNRRRWSSDGGAPGTVRPTARVVAFSNKSMPFVIRRKGRRGRRPLRGLRDVGFSGAVKWTGSLGIVYYTR